MGMHSLTQHTLKCSLSLAQCVLEHLISKGWGSIGCNQDLEELRMPLGHLENPCWLGLEEGAVLKSY